MSSADPSQAEPGSQKDIPKTDEKKGMSLWPVFAIGFVVSLVVMMGFVYFFAAYNTRDWSPWDTRPLMTGDTLFGIIRNAVTLAAALGVGITLFFSYRKQQTAEATQRISAEAQKIAAEALQLTAEQHGSDVTKSMRERFSQAAEHLGSPNASLAIAGAYSLEALASEWYDAGNFRERQNCIDLLCAYPMIAAQHTEQKGFQAASVRSAVATRVFSHLARNLQPRDYWAVRIDMGNPAFMDALSDLYIDGAYVDFRYLSPGEEHGYFKHLEIVRGTLDLGSMDLDRAHLYFYKSRFSGGQVSVGLGEEYRTRGSIAFRECEFGGTDFQVPYTRRGEFSLTFYNCTFSAGSFFNDSTAPRSLSFYECHFNSQVFPTESGSWLERVNVHIDADTTFAEGVPALTSLAASNK
ncbi:hypothetical protein ACFUOZ_00455 [Paenarthrobacter sp. NPDC057355]|uniref:hypothetical protein n=1 Tax=Paenarthrobacter sp. NPDC057355 TaxID=3346105 RepID=UPI00362E09A8